MTPAASTPGSVSVALTAAFAPAAQAGEQPGGDRTVHQPGLLLLPAADKLIGQLTQDPTLVALSLSIDYWDYLGWKDTLALPRHTQRQRAYAQVRGDRQVYTPQAVINGVVHVLGSDRSAIDARHLAESAQSRNHGGAGDADRRQGRGIGEPAAGDIA